MPLKNKLYTLFHLQIYSHKEYKKGKKSSSHFQLFNLPTSNMPLIFHTVFSSLEPDPLSIMCIVFSSCSFNMLSVYFLFFLYTQGKKINDQSDSIVEVNKDSKHYS